MSESNWMKKSGATPRKLALVAVLAVVLVAVVVGQLPSSSATPQLAGRDSSTTQSEPTQTRPSLVNGSQANNGNNSTPSTNQSTSDQPTRIWPKLPLENILSYDPLATPDWLVAVQNAAPPVDETEKRKQKEDVLQRLQEQGAQAIVLSGNEKHAAIGEQSVRIGETIEGFQITDITREGVVLTEYEPK